MSKDWRGAVLELSIIAVLGVAMVLNRELSSMIVGVLAAWGGTIIQRSKIDALTGNSGAPPSAGVKISIPPYAAPPNLPPQGNGQ